jgi:hypothetical protein
MKTKRTVTQRVLAANRANGKHNPGPRNPQNTQDNAITHGLLAKKLVFRNDDEKQSYDALAAELADHHQPFGPTERLLVSEMAISWWRLQELYGWESLEVSNRTNAAAAIVQGLREDGTAQELPLFAATQQGWSAQEMIVRSGSRSSTEDETLPDEARKTGHIILETKMTSSLETILRYGAAIRRDFYRALVALRELQRDRLEADTLQAAHTEDAHDQTE